MITLGGIELDENLQLQGLETAPDLDVSQVITLGGISHVTTMPREGGRQLALSAINEGGNIHGRYTIEQINAIKTLSALRVPVTLVHHLGTLEVLIVSTAEISPVFGYADSQSEDWYTGTIKLIEV